MLLNGDDKALPAWLRDKLGENPTRWPALPPHETILLTAGELRYTEPVDLEGPEDEHLGSIQVLRREAKQAEPKAADLREKIRAAEMYWLRQLPVVIAAMSTIDLQLLTIAAAVIESAWGDETPFETFVKHLLEKTEHRPLDFNTVHRFLCNHPDGNMREHWETVLRVSARSSADFPDGVEEIEEEC